MQLKSCLKTKPAIPAFLQGTTPAFKLNAEQQARLTEFFETMIANEATDYLYKDDLMRNYIQGIDLSPIGLVFYPGEQLRLVISGKNDLGSIMPGTPGYTPKNQGKHIIHTGGAHPSYLQLPVLSFRVSSQW